MSQSTFNASTRGAAAFLKSVDHCTDHMAEGGKKDAEHKALNVISVVSEICAEDVGICGNACSPSSPFCILVRAKLVCLRTHPYFYGGPPADLLINQGV